MSSKTKIRITVNIDDDTYEKLRHDAAQHARSMASHAGYLLEQHYQQPQPGQVQNQDHHK